MIKVIVFRNSVIALPSMGEASYYVKRILKTRRLLSKEKVKAVEA